MSIATIVVESVGEKAVAAVFGKDFLADKLALELRTRQVQVYQFDPKESGLPYSIQPHYVFYFLYGEDWQKGTASYLKEILSEAPSQVVAVVICCRMQSWQVEQVDRYLARVLHRTLRVICTGSQNSSWEVAFQQIFDWTFSAPSSKNQLSVHFPVESGWESPIVFSGEPNSSKKSIHRRQWHWQRLSFQKSFVAIGILMVVILSPGVLLGLPLLLAARDLSSAKTALGGNEILLAKQHFHQAANHLEAAQSSLSLVSLPASLVGQKQRLLEFSNVISLGKRFSLVGEQTMELLPVFQKLVKSILDPTSPDLTTSDLASTKATVSQIQQELDLALGQLASVSSETQQFYLQLFPSPLAPADLPGILVQTKILLEDWLSLVDILPDVLGKDKKMTYLVVFQNSAELRPTGGFIGSYGLATFMRGKLVNLAVQDVYSADGQLQGRVEPPDEVLHFLGQPSWYLRDANWSPDFPLTAKRLEWFLDREIGQAVDGVIAVDIGGIEKLLAITGPVYLADFNETVDAKNLFSKAEFRSEINFFAGSTQKKDFLGSVASAMVQKFSSAALQPRLAIVKKLLSLGESKDFLVYFNNPQWQKLIENTAWSGALNSALCPADKIALAGCMLLVEANFGANKANYYITRKINLAGAASKGGDLGYRLSVSYKNNSPSNTWPGGDYKNYLRFYLPQGATFINMNLGDERKPVVSPILTADVLASVGKDEFLVHASTESGYVSFGSLLTVPVGGEKKVEIAFSSPYKLDLHSSNATISLNFLKQPGTTDDPIEITFEYPTFMRFKGLSGKSKIEERQGLVAFPNKVTYNHTLSRDISLPLSFEMVAP